jgi:hypothetical protein
MALNQKQNLYSNVSELIIFLPGLIQEENNLQ